jgi:hypothetical protein
VSDDALEAWQFGMKAKLNPTALICGAKKWPGSVQFDHSANAPNAKWITTDVEAGEGVDIVMDLEDGPPSKFDKVDGIFCPSILEHVRRPWQAVESMTIMLKSGGLLYIATHQSFPLHYYPQDYFRFSREALIGMAWDANLTVLACGYHRPCRIIPPSEVTVWNPAAESFLDVSICARRP